MRRYSILLPVLLSLLRLNAQVQIDKRIELTGSGNDARVTGIDSVGGATDAVSAEVHQQGRLVFADATGSGNQFVITLNPAAVALNPGMIVHFRSNQNLTGPATLNVNGLGSDTLKKNFNQDLSAGDIRNGQMVSAIWDGTNWQVLSQLNASGGGGSGFPFSGTKRIFATSLQYNGNLGGITGADNLCQQRANAAGLSGNWKALLSGNGVDARNRSTSNAVFVNMQGEVVAFGYKDLFISRANLDNNNDALMNTVSYDEYVNAVSGNWWNGSDESGRGLGNCNDWTNSSGLVGGHIGDVMRMIATSFYGGNGNNWNCNNTARLVCFED